jgi:serine/threonine protein phosphatase PrpC
MSSRLQLKYGLVAEQDRLSGSADAILVTEPTTGSKARTKGSLYLVVTADAKSGRARDAAKLVADTIRREYYYDESAGIAIVLEKAVRAANRRLRHSREGSSLAQGSIGVAVAVVRGNELYVASAGSAEAYLVRAARLLMPEHEAGNGLPVGDAVRIDVWRGEFTVGDSLVICSRNLVDVVGTEELKNAVVTLHPQSAVEHLHHLFVAAGGEGSDAVLAIEATEVSLNRVEHRLVPVNPSEPLAGAPMRSPIPLADQFAGAASAVQDRAVAARSAIREGVAGAVASLLELMPQRRAPYRRITPVTQRRETQRRSAIALLTFISVVGVLGVGLWLWGGPLRGSETPIVDVTTGEAAFRAAQQKADQVFGPADLIASDPAEARELLQDAWTDLERATGAGVDAAAVAELREQVTAGLEELYDVHRVASSEIIALPEGAGTTSLVRGPDESLGFDDAAYMVANRSVVRVNTQTGAAVTVASPGDGPGTGMGAPVLLSRGGPDLVILDVRGGLWRWRPSDNAGGGTLGPIRVSGDQQWGSDLPDIGTFLINPDQGLYRLYVPHALSSQILRYEPAGDGSGFSPPTPYFVGESEPVAEFRQLFIDGDIYALTGDGMLKYFNGRRVGFELDVPPDAEDMRSGHDYRRMAITGERGSGRIYVWDATHARVIAFNKADGTYLEQWLAAGGQPELTDVRGMYVVDRGEVEAPLLIWATDDRLYQTVLASDQVVEPSPEPTIDITPVPSGSPGEPTDEPSGEPTDEPSAQPTDQPSERPRRTPRATP